MSLKLKYSDEISEYSDCPPPGIVGCNARLAYRFVHESSDDPRNFLPVIKVKPQRKFSSETECCLAYSLSLFTSKQTAIKRYAKLKSTNKNIGKLIGTHLMSVELKKGDGLVTKENSDGHFSLFEQKDLDLSTRCQDIEELP